MPLDSDPPAAPEDRPVVIVGIAHARVAGAVLELLRADGRYQSMTCARTRIPRDAALAVVDEPFLRRSSRPLALPAVVLLRSDVERDAAAERAPEAREWLRTSSTGDELLAAIERAVSVPRAVALTEEIVERAVEIVRAIPTPSEVGLLAFGTASGAIALGFLWQVVRQ